MLKQGRLKGIEFFYFLIVTILALLSQLSLNGILPPTFYVVFVIMLVCLMFIARRSPLMLCTAIVIAFTVYSSWSMATDWSTLPRGDPIHYYSYLKRVMDVGHLVEHRYMHAMPFWFITNIVYSIITCIHSLFTVPVSYTHLTLPTN